MREMLLKQANPEHASNSLPPADDSAMMGPIPDDTISAADPLDDVFGGSDDDAPVFEEEGDPFNEASSTIQIIRDETGASTHHLHHHPSDMHRLQQEHTTAGYREGITVAKATSVQSGFDEGFGLGATIGLRVGRLLGMLEGIAGALQGSRSPSAVASELQLLLSNARKDLDLRSVFGETFWNPDGTWKYEVESEGKEDETVLFSHVAEAHPLVRKWTAVVEGEMKRWGLQEQLPILERREDEGQPLVEPMVRAKATVQSHGEAKAPNEELRW